MFSLRNKGSIRYSPIYSGVHRQLSLVGLSITTHPFGWLRLKLEARNQTHTWWWLPGLGFLSQASDHQVWKENVMLGIHGRTGCYGDHRTKFGGTVWPALGQKSYLRSKPSCCASVSSKSLFRFQRERSLRCLDGNIIRSPEGNIINYRVIKEGPCD